MIQYEHTQRILRQLRSKLLYAPSLNFYSRGEETDKMPDFFQELRWDFVFDIGY